MRLKFGFFAGIFLGYYLGAMAGRERYEQLNRVLRKVRRSDAVDAATDKARAAAGDGLHKAKDELRHRVHRNGSDVRQPYSPSSPS